jgi:hypothetical protein
MMSHGTITVVVLDLYRLMLTEIKKKNTLLMLTEIKKKGIL